MVSGSPCLNTSYIKTRLIVLSEVLWVQRFTQGEFLWVSEPQVSGHAHTRVEGLHAEVHRAVDISQVWQLDPAKTDS